MTSFVQIEAGQWVLAFYEPYGPFDREMSEHLEMFTSQGGGWDHHRETEIFRLHRVTDVKGRGLGSHRGRCEVRSGRKAYVSRPQARHVRRSV